MGDDTAAFSRRCKEAGRQAFIRPRSTSGSRRWTRRASTWRCCRSTRSGIARIATWPPRSSGCRTKSSRNSARRNPTASPLSPRWRCNSPISPSQQLETAMKKQGLRGAAIGGSVAGEEFSDPKFHPVWAKAEELGAVLFIHPQSIPELAKRLKGNGWLTNTIGTADRNHDRAVAPDLRGHARPLPRPEDHLGARRRLSAVLCRPLRPRLFHQPGGLRSRNQAEEEADRILEAALFRLAGLQPRSAAASGRSGRRQPDHARQRLPLSRGRTIRSIT